MNGDFNNKIIHYCWFGGGRLPDLSVKCIESWKKFFPQFEIKVWNESNYDTNICNYVKQAAKLKKWAFVSDFARFDILYKFGGLYFDTDVEVIKSFDDIISKGPFMGCELAIDNNIAVNPGSGIYAIPGMNIYKEIIDDYSITDFNVENKSGEYVTVVDRVTKILKGHGLKNVLSMQKIEGINIYPYEYFSPIQYESQDTNITEKTYSIHYYSATWVPKEVLDAHNIRIKYRKKYKVFGNYIGFIINFKTYFLYHLKNKGAFGTIIYIIKKYLLMYDEK